MRYLGACFVSDGKIVSGLHNSSSPGITAFERRGWRYGPKGLGLGLVQHRLVGRDADTAVCAGQDMGWIFSSVTALYFINSR